MLWLHAPAGTGKSTFARTLVDQLSKSRNLVAGYFFRRGEIERNSASRIFPTIASQLIENIPHFEHSLRKSLKHLSRDDILKKSLEEQFNILLQTPLDTLLPFSLIKPVRIIIIDALDECNEDYPTVLRLLEKLSSLGDSNTLRLCVLITSRRAE